MLGRQILADLMELVEKNNMIKINIEKAKTVAHDIRRKTREQEFSPLDNLIMKQIPNTDIQAVEQQRQQIRDKYALMQDKIDKASSIEEIKEALK